MSYYEEIRELTKKVSVSIVDFSTDRDTARIPTQASSNFITNKEQGDWAEKLIISAFNTTSKNFVAVKYGKSDDLVAGEDGFDKFFQDFQNELDTIGKRPDILIFSKKDFEGNLGHDISKIEHSQIENYVKKAVSAIEVRSSAFLISKYDLAMQNRIEKFTKQALAIKDGILKKYKKLLSIPQRNIYLELLSGITPSTIEAIDFKVPGWRSTEELVKVNELLQQLKKAIKEIQKRDYLSITPKVEDIKVVYKWIEKFNVPHYYFQVFFDKAYGISFSRILDIISNPDNEGVIFSIEQDTKNQNKTAIKINSKSGILIAGKVEEPSHKSVRKELDRGRLLFYVTFEDGCAYLDITKLKKLLNLQEEF
ncbi:MAG: AccI family restriction endonuclease [Endomicrobium sp.]|jgi:type II restriction enzyme|nr:AccI family restriction endonuclease [Endomicrobium sp.]